MSQQLKELIKVKAAEIGIDKIGFTHAEPFYSLEDKLIKQHAKGHHSGFEHKVIEERIYPEKIFAEPKSIIAIALAYPSKMRNKPPRVKGERRGEFARASWGTDYHYVLQDRMDKLIAYIEEVAPGEVAFKPMVDTGELVDVAVAQRAGLGFIGRNGLLITEEFGSYVYLGEILTNIDFEPDEEVAFGCGDCTRCVDACPTDALLGDGRMNANRCLSYQTQTKGYMPKEYRRKMGHVIYGCDICQIVCPYNKGVDSHFHEEMEPEPFNTMPELKPLLTISNREFKETFGDLAGSWRGKKPLQRNAIIALANYRDYSAVPDLLNVIDNDVRPMIRGTAAWAIATITKKRPNEEIVTFLEEALLKETDEETITEFKEAIGEIKARLNKLNAKES
ncbi:tRNA epoxyqueuosine(34) reductase QueG [Alkalibacterium putridalgicola]|uniref:Epoxyqueuosine reductase n=1 Tax=Alkalibacterium putridalgicola TaxID=426703 RepID=A0A1H7TA90_9LACT|nr:tRNA epoxyqueuosine(34) reductase QueG [Alkalibacterium putridalgicola]GEK89302.1 epoxyqueuosine reductase [Alkalibacterium putridalgicola]SEL81429.1 epoxyqueuosine reductase [Alkalibacterium putridalgicola]